MAETRLPLPCCDDAPDAAGCKRKTTLGQKQTWFIRSPASPVPGGKRREDMCHSIACVTRDMASRVVNLVVMAILGD